MSEHSNSGAQVEELLPAYAWGELSEEDSLRVEAAVAESPRLQDELSHYERLSVLMAAAVEEQIEAPANLRGRIDRQVALKAYVGAAEKVMLGVLGAYGKALIDYLRLA